MSTFPTVRAYIDWANLVNAPGYSEYTSGTLIPVTPAVSVPWLSYLRLDDPVGSTAADDMAWGRSSTATNVAFGYPAALGRDASTSAWFDGAGRIPVTSFSPYGTITVAAMVRPRLLNGGYIVSSGNGGAGVYVNASGYVVLAVPGTGDICTSTAALALDTWAHVAVTYDGTTARIYVNGADVSGATTVRAPGAGLNPVVGANNTTGTTYASFFTGALAEVGVGYGVMTGRQVAYIASLARDPWSETNADMTGLIAEPLTIKRGRSADYSSDATGSCSFSLNNAARLYDPQRNWCDNGSMETDLSHWSDEAGPYTSGGALRRVRDTAGYGGYYAGEADAAASVNSGVSYVVRYPVRPGVACSVFVAMKGISGQTAYELVVGSATDASDYAVANVTLTGAWAAYTLAWTPKTASTEVRIVVRTATATAGTFRIDALAFSTGTATAFVEAPTRGQLVPGRSVLIVGAYETVSEPLFFGTIDAFSPDAATLSVSVTCKDAFAILERASLVYQGFTGTHRGYRAEVLRRALAGWRNEDRGGWTTITAAGATTRKRPLLDIPTGEALQFSGEVRVAAGVPLAAGTFSVRIAAYKSGASPVYLDVPVAAQVGGEWVPFSVSYKTQGAANVVEYGFVNPGTGRRIETRNLLLTTGAARHAYVPFGDSYLRSFRHNAAYLNPSGEAHQGYWNVPPVNRCTNPSFETNTTGWSVASGYLHTAATSITRTAGGYLGSWCGRVATSGVGQGTHFTLSGTFTSGTTYFATLWVKSSSGAGDVGAYFGYSPSADIVSAVKAVTTSGWTRFDFTLEMTANRTSVQVGAYSSTAPVTSFDIDGVLVYAQYAPDMFYLNAADPLCLDSSATESTYARITTDGYDGTACLQITSGNAIAYPLQAAGPWTATDYPDAVEGFDGDVSSGRSHYYTASLYVKTPSAGQTVYLTFGSQSDPANAGTTTYVTQTNGWERVAVRWTSTSGTSLALKTDVWVVLRGPVSTKVDCLLVSEGRRLWPFRPAWVEGMDTTEDAWIVPVATPTGTALSTLAALNAANLTRHWIDPLATAPYWTYRTRTASTLPSKTVVETYADDVSGITGADTSFDTVQNVAHVTPSTRYIIPDSPTGGYVGTASGYTGDVYASDPDSVDAYGRSDASAISGDYWENRPGDRTLQEALAELTVARYRDPRPRPSIVVENRWPSQLVRGPDDLVALDFPRLGLASAPYLIVSLQHDISVTGRYWRTTYQLEEFGYAPTDYSLAGGLPEYAGPEYSLPAGMPM